MSRRRIDGKLCVHQADQTSLPPRTESTRPDAKPIKPKVTIEVACDASDVVEPLPLMAASNAAGHGLCTAQSLLIGYGSRQLLQFEQIEYNLAEKNQVLIRADPKKRAAAAGAGLSRQAQQAVGKERALKTVQPVVDASAEYQTRPRRRWWRVARSRSRRSKVSV